MCYNAAYELERSFKYAIRSEMDPNRRAELERMYNDWKKDNPDIYKEKHQPGEAQLERQVPERALPEFLPWPGPG